MSFTCSKDEVLSILVRSCPQLMIKCHEKLFCNPRQVFRSIKKEWLCCLYNADCVRELTPEFFLQTSTGLFENHLRLDLGSQSATQKRSDNVKLPRWARSPQDFLDKHL